jgi:hypothetical protein
VTAEYNYPDENCCVCNGAIGQLIDAPTDTPTDAPTTFIEVTNWADMKTACGSSGTVSLGDGFVMGTYSSVLPLPQFGEPGYMPQMGGIDFSGKHLVVIGNGKTLDAGLNGRLFYGHNGGGSLEFHGI